MKGKSANLSGRFGRLVVLGQNFSEPPGKGAVWACLCDCGRLCNVRTSNLVSGNTQSCGCYKIERIVEVGHANRVHGGVGTPTHNSWRSMLGRCTDKNLKHYPQYGGRGIRVDERWLSFVAFHEDMRDRPDGTTLDRIDNNGNYEKDNCRWATAKEQGRNQRSNRIVEFDGRSQTLSAWSEETGIKFAVLHHRLRLGWSIERALTTKKPPRKSPRSRRTDK